MNLRHGQTLAVDILIPSLFVKIQFKRGFPQDMAATSVSIDR